MLDIQQLDSIIGADVIDGDGGKIGSVGQVFLDDATGQPEWVTVSTGWFGTKQSFVPLAEGTFEGGALVVPFGKETVKGAPNVDVEAGHLSEQEEAELYRYYDLADGDSGSEAVRSGTADVEVGSDVDVRPAVGDADLGVRGSDADVAGTDGDDAMTRSEERLRVGTERVETGRARLRKYVTTETQTVQVPVTTEHVRVETEPITDANRDAALAGPEIGEAEYEVVLTEERPVVTTETVPVERVRLTTEAETVDQTVSADLRREVIETEGVTQTRR